MQITSKLAMREKVLSFNPFFFLYFSPETVGLLVVWLSTTPSYFATGLYWSAVEL